MSKIFKLKFLPVLILVFHLLLLTCLKFTAWPEMTLWPYLMTKGWLPYGDIAIAHTPLMLLDLGIFYAIFGTGIWQLKIFTWLLILGTDGLVYWIVKKIWDRKTSLVALISFVLLQVFYDGNGLWFDLYMGILAFVSYYFIKKKDFFWAGVLWTLAFASKQTAVWFLIPIGMELVQVAKNSFQGLKKFFTGSIIVAGLFILLLLAFGLLPSFYEWAVRFGLFILPQAEGQVQLPGFKNLAVSMFPFLIFIPLIWRTKSKNINLLFWAIAGGLGAYPRFEYFHFQPALPYLAIAIALVFTGPAKKDNLVKYFVFFYVFGCTYLFANFFMRNYKEGIRFYERDVQDVVSYVKSNTFPDDSIFVMNWWDNIYALSDRLPATNPWIPQLSWYMEIPGIQEKMVTNLENNKPKLIILNQYTDVGLSAYVPQKVYDYVTENYKFKDKVDGINILIRN